MKANFWPVYIASFFALGLTNMPALAQADATKCAYTNLETKESTIGVCTIGQAGVVIESPTLKATDGGLKRISIEIKSRQGVWATVELNGKPGIRFEIDRCTHQYATNDLREFLEVTTSPCGQAGVTAQTSQERSISMTAGGAWVGRWYTGNPRLCRGTVGETEGLLSYTTKEVVGLENSCEVKKINPRGKGVEIIMTCSSEGMKSQESEFLEVSNGKLLRTVAVGRNRQTFSYSRCN